MPFDNTKSDPSASRMVAEFIKGKTDGHGRPIPLVATRIEVDIADGVAVVTTGRVFRNGEESSIESTVTFPVPLHATLTSLSYRIDGRTVTASAQRRQQARDTYEGALERGKSAALHEEILRGIHMLSVGHVPAGKEVTVTSVWAAPMAAAGDTASLRIPVTVGDIFGLSPLPDSDDLVHDAGVRHTAELTVACRDGAAHLAGGGLVDGKATVDLDHPIDILVPGPGGGVSRGVAADGRTVTLRITRDVSGDGAVDGVVLADMSGSMDSPASGHREAGLSSKYEVMRAGLAAAAGSLRAGDKVDLLEFDDAPHRRKASSFRDAVAKMRGTCGGTEIGLAISEALAGRETSDVLLITDGKSHALDVQRAARSGRRFTVVLIGEDSLEGGGVGALAALTGGQIFIARGSTDGAIVQAFASMRRPHAKALPITGLPDRVETRIGGMAVEAVWGSAEDAKVAGTVVPAAVAGQSPCVPALAPTGTAGQTAGSVSGRERIIGALAAALAIPLMEEEGAAAFAEAHGIGGHLTSLVLVDEAGETQDGIPAQRKVPLMTPRTHSAGMVLSGAPSFLAECSFAPPARGPSAMRSLSFDSLASPAQVPPPRPARERRANAPRVRGGVRALQPPTDHAALPPVPAGAASLRGVLGRIDWAADPERLRKGDLGGLAADVRRALELAASAVAEIAVLAGLLGVSAGAVAVALVARAEAGGNRNAARLARSVFGSAGAETLDAAARAVGL